MFLSEVEAKQVEEIEKNVSDLRCDYQLACRSLAVAEIEHITLSRESKKREEKISTLKEEQDRVEK